jgi:hypothetical protein
MGYGYTKYIALMNGEKVPRKIKKSILGRKLNKSKLRKLLESVEIIKNPYPESATILPYRFCPKCGCREIRFTDNMAEYPERWVRGYCARCSNKVVESDNSPYYHCLEFEGYELPT